MKKLVHGLVNLMELVTFDGSPLEVNRSLLVGEVMLMERGFVEVYPRLFISYDVAF